MLALTSAKSASLVGVFISVTTVPAAAFASVALVEGRFAQAAESALQLVVNLVGIVVAAVAVLLVYRGPPAARAYAASPAGSRSGLDVLQVLEQAGVRRLPAEGVAGVGAGRRLVHREDRAERAEVLLRHRPRPAGPAAGR